MPTIITRSLPKRQKKRGCTVIKGEEWLLNQAVPAYRLFTGIEPDRDALETMRQALVSAAAVRAGKPKNIALIGFMGCGKSAVGKLLAGAMGFIFKDTDQLIEAQEGCSIPGIFAARGEDYFRKVEKDILKRELQDCTGMVYGCGGGAVLDDENKKILKAGALVVWLYASIPTTLERLEPGTRPLLEVPNREEKAWELLQQRLNHYAETADLIVGSEKSAADTAEKIHEEIRQTFGD